ncbi:hypothetical protein SLEP1_g22279 [Rubroshorea leprosula]|uniref:Uncharacterized protein n=1 Tax=Rubroshorea leprosula TaxID=152421 RepID=A0AAV5J8P2_9ROSI|nr:hypothetical protein SLEP1_g22279 [Rubroshorea leprosula]
MVSFVTDVMLVENDFVEILHGILKLVALSQTLQISGNVECLRRLVRRWCTSTQKFILAFGEVIETLEDVANLMLSLIVGEENPRQIALTPKERATLVALKKTGEGKDSLCEAPFSPFDVRFRPYHSSRVIGGKALKEYPMANVVTPAEQLHDYSSFNFLAYKTMPGTFAPPEVSLFDKALLAVLESQIMEFTMGNSSHLEMLVVITPSMLPCIKWRGTWSLECYCPERVARQFGCDQDVPFALSLDKTDWNRAMRPYIDEVAMAMWSEGAATQVF